MRSKIFDAVKIELNEKSPDESANKANSPGLFYAQKSAHSFFQPLSSKLMLANIEITVFGYTNEKCIRRSGKWKKGLF